MSLFDSDFYISYYASCYKQIHDKKQLKEEFILKDSFQRNAVNQVRKLWWQEHLGSRSYYIHSKRAKHSSQESEPKL